ESSGRSRRPAFPGPYHHERDRVVRRHHEPARPGEESMDLPFRIPGTSEPEITVRRSTFGGLTLLVDGAPVKGQRGRYPIQLPDGTVKELRLTGQWTGLKAVVD